MKKIIFPVWQIAIMSIVIATAAFFTVYWKDLGTKKESQKAQINNESQNVKLYYYNSNFDRDEGGNIMCSRKGLVPVERKILPTDNITTDTLNLLLKGELTDAERARGIDTEYPLEGFSLEKSSLKDGILTLEFDDSKNQTVGGACRVGILWFQIEATAKQFPEAKEVRFLPEDIFQP